MATKISAAHIATRHGVDMIIANASMNHVVGKIFEGKPIGTLFLAE